MNRRSFLSALGRLGAAVVASPLAALLPETTAARLICVWRGRIIWVGVPQEPDQWFMTGNLDKLGGFSK